MNFCEGCKRESEKIIVINNNHLCDVCRFFYLKQALDKVEVEAKLE